MNFGLYELLWLLLPLAAASGWWVARLDYRRRGTPRDSKLSSDYFRGINHLLNEQPDKAIEVFTRMVEINTETVETHLALGSLFRRRGEIERAIRIHQNLIARPALDRTQRALALCELAQDYLRAGLLDRAENLFIELAEIPAHTDQALRSLISLYEQEKEWVKATDIARRLAQSSGRNLGLFLAHYCCERAEILQAEGKSKQAQGLLQEALSHDARCVRANVLDGKYLASRGEDRDAIAAWQKVEKQDPVFLDEVIDDIAAAYRRLGDEPGLYSYLSSVVRRRPGVRVVLTLAELVRQRDGIDAAQRFVAERLQQYPTLVGLKRFVDLHTTTATEATGEASGGLVFVAEVLKRLSSQQEGYECRQCGFRGGMLHWQCPACHEWATLQAAACPSVTAASETRQSPPARKARV